MYCKHLKHEYIRIDTNAASMSSLSVSLFCLNFKVSYKKCFVLNLIIIHDDDDDNGDDDTCTRDDHGSKDVMSLSALLHPHSTHLALLLKNVDNIGSHQHSAPTPLYKQQYYIVDNLVFSPITGMML